jgi:hypothetical protein
VIGFQRKLRQYGISKRFCGNTRAIGYKKYGAITLSLMSHDNLK